MRPTNNWNETQAVTTSEYVDLKMTEGGHICKILKSEEAVTNSGKPVLDVYFDIAEGTEFDGFYMKKLEQQKKFSADAKYQGRYRIFQLDKDGNTNPYFKGFITAVEDSNPGYKWNWDEKTLKGKKVGIVFRMEEYSVNGYDGEVARPFYACKASDAPNMPIPKPKKLQNRDNPVNNMAQMAEAEDTDLPF